MSSNQANSKYFNSLTGIRAVAAFMVYLHHFNPIPENYVIHSIFNEMYIGVTLFFVLSGFLIAYRYMDLNNFSFRTYIVNRVARIYPMYFLITTLTFMPSLYNHFSNSQLILYGLNISMLRGFFDDFKFSGVGQGWTLTVEETFYILAPLFFFLISRRKIYLAILPAITILVGTSLVLIFSKTDFYGLFASFEFMFNYTFFGRCAEFFAGISLAVIYKHDVSFLKKFNYFTYSGILGIIVSLILLMTVKGDYDFGIRHPIGKIINTLFLPIFGICMLFYGLLKEQTLISKIISTRLFILLGKSSYIFYLIHMGVFVTALGKLGLTSSDPISYLVLFAVLNLISILIYRYIEQPSNIYIKSFAGG